MGSKFVAFLLGAVISNSIWIIAYFPLDKYEWASIAIIFLVASLVGSFIWVLSWLVDNWS